jgi:shikimate kinase
VLHPDTQAALAHHRVVLLTVAPHNVAARIRGGARPSCRRATPSSAGMRSTPHGALYERLAQVSFDTSAGPLQDAVDAVAAWIEAELAGDDHARGAHE